MLQRLLYPARNRQRDRLAASSWIAKLLVERALDAGIPLAVDVGVADDMSREAELRIKPVGLALQGQARLRQEGQQVVLERIEAVVPVKSLNTGIGQRDEHMRKHIFTTADGQTPDLRFLADEVACPAPAGRESTCSITGQLAVRGTERPFALTLKVRSENGSFKAAGEGLLKLSDWGIERPSQLGVQTGDEVKLRLEFTATPSTRVSEVGGGER